MNDTFNPLDWIEPDPKPTTSDQSQCAEDATPGNRFAPSPPRPLSPSSISTEVDTVISRIESSLTDITTSYPDWLNVGFAFANEFGEAGRAFFHRASRFYNGYTKAETDKQYDQCLKSQGHGITIKTFFHLAQQAGVDVTMRSERERWGDGEMGRDASQRSDGAANIDPFAPSCHHPLAPSSSNYSDQSQCSEGAASGTPFAPSPHHPLAPSSSDPDDDAPPEEEQPTLPDDLFDQLPDFFKRVVSRADSREERDMLLLGSMVALGSCLTTFSGIYDGNQVFPTLFLYIAAKASSGKGRLVMCRNLVNPVHWEKRKQGQQESQLYEVELREYNAQKGKDMGIEKPAQPHVRMHIIPANNTTAGLLQLLSDNNGEGLIIETEGDTIAKTIKKEISDFSDFMRKGFHHEMISGYRKTDHEHSEVEQPRFNMILSSTMGQLKELIPSTENGLSSRFMFYYMNIHPVWKDVFAHSNSQSLNQHFNDLGQEFYTLYKTLRANDPIEFGLTREQQETFNAFFAQMQDKYLVLQGLDYMAIVRRLGLIAFRMMMILTAMRIPETGDFSVRQECSDEDFDTALAIIKVIVRHASYIVSQMPAEVITEKRGNKKERFYEGLAERFTRKEYLAVAKSLNIPDRSADRFIASFCDKKLIQKDQVGIYLNQKQ